MVGSRGRKDPAPEEGDTSGAPLCHARRPSRREALRPVPDPRRAPRRRAPTRHGPHGPKGRPRPVAPDAGVEDGVHVEAQDALQPAARPAADADRRHGPGEGREPESGVGRRPPGPPLARRRPQPAPRAPRRYARRAAPGLGEDAPPAPPRHDPHAAAGARVLRGVPRRRPPAAVDGPLRGGPPPTPATPLALRPLSGLASAAPVGRGLAEGAGEGGGARQGGRVRRVSHTQRNGTDTIGGNAVCG